jgi:membrane protein DedA with SNARE-associated domain
MPLAMALEAIIARYGLLAILIGSGIEGEAVVVTGGILAHRHLVPLWQAAAASAIGSCVVDQLWFFLGRRFRDHPWLRRFTGKPAYARAMAFLERRPNSFIFGFRFIYGLRTISPIAIGTSRIETRRFVILNMVAAAVWGPLFTLIGFVFGRAVDPILDRIEDGGRILFAIALAVAVAVAIWAFFRRRRSAQPSSEHA